jgi:hypothetical protein
VLDESQLVIVTRGSVEHLDLAATRAGRTRLEYIAQGKERLEDIAKRYGMTKYDLARINRINHETVLAKGDKIVVYQAVDPKRSERAELQWKKTPRGKRGKVSEPRAVGSANSPEQSSDEDETSRTSPGPVTKPGQTE